MKIVEVNNIWQAFILRNIRNECREFMTRDKKKIGVMRQLEWYLFKYSNAHHIGKLNCYLFYEGDEAVGYGLVVLRDGHPWITGGLRAKVRGRGLGTELFGSLVEMLQGKRIFLEVLETNEAGYKIYSKLGFKKIKKEGNIITMRKKIIKKR